MLISVTVEITMIVYSYTLIHRLFEDMSISMFCFSIQVLNKIVESPDVLNGFIIHVGSLCVRYRRHACASMYYVVSRVYRFINHQNGIVDIFGMN